MVDKWKGSFTEVYNTSKDGILVTGQGEETLYVVYYGWTKGDNLTIQKTE